jgi:hypothetical protein
MASDLLFVTRPDGTPVKYDVGDHQRDPIILEPSCVALVSTAERFTLPQDLGAHVSVKWSLARLGILVLTGGFVNPGFGYTEVDGKWQAVPDERLHFLVANLGNEPQVLIPDSTILASLQFVTIVGAAGNRPVASTQRLISSAYGPDAPLKALSLFPQFAAQREDLGNLDERMDRVERGALPLVTFGVYLLAVTFLGVILNASLSLVSDARVSRLAHAVPRDWPFALLGVTFLVCVTVMFKKILDVVTEVVRRPRRRRHQG